MILASSIKRTDWIILRNIMLLSLIVVIESIQLLLIFGWILSFFPLNVPSIEIPLKESAYMFRPEREALYFWFFIATATILQTLGIIIYKKRFNDPAWNRRLIPFLIVETIMLFFMLSALFKTVIYDNRPRLAHMAFHTLIVFSILIKIFWMKIKDLVQSMYALIMRPENSSFLRKFLTVGFPIIIFLIVFMPDQEAVVARIWIGEQFHHFNSFLMAAAWAYKSGNILNADQVLEYGIGLPVVIAHLSRFFGGFDFLNVFIMMMWFAIFYYIAWFFLLKRFFGSLLMAVFTMLMAMRTHLFQTGGFPFIFGIPSGTMMRVLFDIFFFFFIYLHWEATTKPPESWIKKKGIQFWSEDHPKYLLILAGIVSGIMTFYMVSIGLPMIISFYVYLTAYLSRPHLRPFIYRSKKDIPWIVLFYSLGPVVAGLLFWTTVGDYLFMKTFWDDMIIPMKILLAGTAAMPFLSSFQNHDYLANMIGVFAIAILIVSILILSSLIWFNKIDRKHLFIVVLSVYGLGILQYYVSLTAITSYYSVGLPFMFVTCYWIHQGVKRLSFVRRRNVSLVLILLAIYAMVTNHNFLAFPNSLNLSRNPLIDRLVAQHIPDGRPYFNHLFINYIEEAKMPKNSLGEKFEGMFVEEDFRSQEELKAWFRSEFNYPEDAKLIADRTQWFEKVPLISSFDTKILLQANRKPFFYHFPMVVSRPMRTRTLGVTGMYTTGYYDKTIGQLETEKPKYIFMERLYLQVKDGPVPRYYYYQTPALLDMLKYIFERYEPEAYGKYLVALKRKDPIHK